jgi:hypothetical protein
MSMFDEPGPGATAFLTGLADGGPVLELATFAVPPAARGRFPVACLVVNSLFTLVDTDRQIAGFRAVARMLAPGGAFVMSALVPDPAGFERDERHPQVRPAAPPDHHDRAAQTFVRRPRLATGAVEVRPAGLRYLWPGQIDRLAAPAGLRLEARYADWHRRPFEATSTGHVTVYRLTGP